MDKPDSEDRSVTDILSDLGLSKFSDQEIQNGVKFLSDLKAGVKHRVQSCILYFFSVQLCDNIQGVS